MKKRILSTILAFSLTISLFVVPASAANSTIGVTTQLDTESADAWTNYFKTHAINSELVQFLADSLGISATRSVVCWKLVDYVVNSYGLGEQSLSRLTSICSSYSHAFYNESITTVKSVFDFLLASGTGRWQLAKFWQLMFGVVPEFVIDDQWGTSGIYRIKEVNSGLYVCSSTGRYAYADYGATVVSSDSSDKSSYQWIGDRTASDRSKNGKVQIVLEHNLQLLQDQLRREGTGNYIGTLGTEYKCIWNGLRQVLANANGDPIVYRIYKAPYIINEEPRTPVEEDESEIITDPSYFVDQDGNWYPTESLIYDNSTHSYTTNNYTYNYDNRTYEYKTWNIDYHINYTYIYNIGQSEVLEEYTQYYKLPDGRSSADLTKEELEQLNLNMDVINYQVVNDASSLLGLWHLDGNLIDSSFYGSDAFFSVGSSITYLDSGAFNGSLYLPSLTYEVDTSSPNIGYQYPVSLLFPINASGFDPSGDWTVEFRIKVTPTSSDDPALSVALFGAQDPLTSSNMSPGIFKLSNAVWTMNDQSGAVSAGTAATYGVWNHITLMHSGNNLNFFVNGNPVPFSDVSSLSFTTSMIQFQFDCFKGAYEIDEVRVSGEALHPSNGTFIVPSVPYDTNLVLVLPDLDDTEVTTLSSPAETIPVEALSESPAFESLSALSSEAVVTYNASDGEHAIVPYASTARQVDFCIVNNSSYTLIPCPVSSSLYGTSGYFYLSLSMWNDETNVPFSYPFNGWTFGQIGELYYTGGSIDPGETVSTYLTLSAEMRYVVGAGVGNTPVSLSPSATTLIESGYSRYNYTLVITDVPQTGSLQVSCTNVNGNSADTFYYTVTLGDTSISGTYGGMTFTNGVASFSLTGGSSKTASDLPAGTAYTVTQGENTFYTIAASGLSGTISAGSTSSVSFTNTYVSPYGSLKLSNTVTGTNVSDSFTYTITLGNTSYSGNGFTNGVRTVTLAANQSLTINDLPETTYTVTQADFSAYTTTSTGSSGSIVKGSTAVASFTNTAVSVPMEQSVQITNPILAIKSQTPVKDYQIGGVRPTYPSVGLVWALVENGYITSIQIYTGYAWEAVDARIWTGSRWIPYNYFNVITLNDMYDIVDASGNQGYEYLYTESGFWNWWQRAWTDFVKLFQNTKFGGDGSSSGSGVTEDTETNIGSGEYSSGNDVTVVEAVSDSGKGLWSILKAIFGVVGNVFSESGSIGDAFEVTFDDSGGEDSAFYIFDVPLEQMSPTG